MAGKLEKYERPEIRSPNHHQCLPHQPKEAPCCQRIIGCGQCVQGWILTNSRCPLCSVSGHMTEVFGLKGIDDLTGFFRLGESEDSQASLSQLGPGRGTINHTLKSFLDIVHE